MIRMYISIHELFDKFSISLKKLQGKNDTFFLLLHPSSFSYINLHLLSPRRITRILSIKSVIDTQLLSFEGIG